MIAVARQRTKLVAAEEGAAGVRDHLYPLDALRFLAALSVLSYHLCFFGWASEWGTTASMLDHAARYTALAPFTWFGWIGVEIFFVISGFVIAHSAHGRPPFDFLKGRVLRLYPAAWICATITLSAWLLIDHKPVLDLLNAYLRSMSLWVVGPWVDGVYWSLAVEIVFYTIVFFVLVGGRFIQLAALPWWLTALSILHVVSTLPASAEFPRYVHFLGSAALAHADDLLARRACFFAAGIWLWQMSEKAMSRRRYVGLAVAVACGLVEISEHAHDEARQLVHAMALPIWLPLTIWTLAFCIIFGIARAPHMFGVHSPSARAVLTRIGVMTYPLFLVHDAVGAGIIRVAVASGINQWAALALAVVAVLALAYFICAVLEVGVRKRLRPALDAIGQLAQRLSKRRANAQTSDT